MASLFRRNFKATIVNEASGDSIDIEDMRISFRLTKTKKAKGNKAIVSIYNLSPDVRSAILAPVTKTGKPQVSLQLFTGYGKESSLLFNGVGVSSSEWVAPNFISKFTLTDDAAQTVKPFNRKYPKGSSLDIIIGNLIAATNLVQGIIQPTKISLKRSRSFSGDPGDILSSLASTYGFIYDIQGGKASIVQTDFTAVRTFANLGADSGLLGVPYWEGSIVKARCLLLPQIAPGTVVTLIVPETELKGTYLVAKVTAKGDNWGKDGFMDLELEPRDLAFLYETLPNLELLI